ncbi:DUF1579 domain-containing protein [Rhizobium tubonense]|uniref:DUF1579 domain-containing protein n=1 Tax=Rhizobium tubonense TaxID=484088 RepID=A0A2W4CX69_9HYPH|nr:DUF1579 domain-containing protein [Rhizobium tubonense]PZM17197.1 hypothetical protein CPY51_02930 [Rhizobium tubonense]
MKTATPTKEHAFLQKLVGNWDIVADAMASNPEHATWRETVRSLHGLWVVAEGHGEMPGGGAASTMLTLGYDPDKGRYVGNWIDSVINHMWIYEGRLDESGRTLLLETEGPDVETKGRTARYQECVSFEDDDNRTFTSHILTPDGSWRQLMTMQYRRRV